MPDTTEKKTYLVNVESNLDQYAAAAAKAEKEVDDLEKANLRLRNSGQASREEVIKNNAELAAAKKRYTDAKKEVQTFITASQSEANSRKQLGEILKLQQRELGKVGNAYIINAKGIREINPLYIEQEKRIKATKDAIIQYDKAQSDGRTSVGLYSEAIDKSLGGLQAMPGPLGAAAGGITRMATAAKAFIATPIGAVIAALAAAIGVLTSYFKRSEEGQNAFTKVTKVLGSVLDNILDVVDKVGKALFEAFSKPKEAVAALWEALKTNIVNRFTGLVDLFTGFFDLVKNGFKGVGLSIQAALTINPEKKAQLKKEAQAAFDGVKEAAKVVGESTIQVMTGVDDLIGKIGRSAKEFFQEVSQDAKDADALAAELAQIAKDERRELVENAKIAKESAALRAEAERIKFINAEEAIRLTQESFALDEKVLQREVELAKRKAANARESARLANSTIEILDQVAQLEADVEAKQAAFNEKRRERTRVENKLRKEAFTQEKERLTALLEIEKSKTDAIIADNQLIIDNEVSTFDERTKALEDNLKLRTDILAKQAELELQEIDKDFELQTISQENAEIKKLAVVQKYASEQKKVASDIADDNKKLVDELLKYENDKRAINAKNTLALQELNNAYEFDLQKQKLKNEYDSEIFAAKKTGADVLLINQKYAAAQRKIDEAEAQAKLGLYAGFSRNLATIFGENTAIGKAAAIAETTVNTYASATASYKALAGIPVVGPALGVVAAAAAVAAGIANVKKIVAVKSGLPGEGSIAAPTTITNSGVRVTAPQATILNQPQLTQSQLNAVPNQNTLTAASLAAEIKKIPPPIVTVEAIEAVARNKTKVEVRANI